MDKALLKVIENRRIAKDIYRITLEGNLVSAMTQPGQFVHIKCSKGIDPILRRPISICDVDLHRKQMKMIYRAEGRGTVLLSQTVPGDEVDVLGPLGHGFPYEHFQDGQKAVLIGGGIGVPPLYYLSKTLRQAGLEVMHILGFQSQKYVFYEHEFEQLGLTYVTTLDGSYGTEGLVTDVLDQWPEQQWDAVFSCGPTPMLKAIEDRFKGHSEIYLSLEQRMGCGVGACFACVSRIPESETDYRKICSDGPVFKAGEVIL